MPTLPLRAKDVFLRALTVPAPDRGAFVAEACGTDARLRQEVESLLAHHEDTGTVTVPPPDTVGTRFAAGQVFGDRYRMIARLGRGGMGEVWHADDLVLKTPVALKFIRSTRESAVAGILNEVRLARKITHPAVCRVFDVGQADGEVFFSMELVRGEDLASLIKRVGRLPSEKVIDIGRQLCGGLAAAHAEGILHRDLKPANVLIDEDGQVRITDFGIAVTQLDPGTHTLIGTPGYMAPEQLLPGAPLTERTDVYTLGLLLYELIVGQHPFRSGTRLQPTRPSTLVQYVDPQLERLVLQALSADPEDRPASADAFAASLPTAMPIDVASSTKRWWLAGAAAAVIVVAALAAMALPMLRGRGTPALTEQDTIVLADFMNTTGEPVFDGALKVALAVAIEQSPFLKVFPDERIRETLRLMNRPPDTPITRPIAREIAQREQVKALFAGSIAPLGRNYVLAVEAVNAQTGDVMAREQIEVTAKEQVLTALGGVASKLREKLGESLASIQKFDVSLPRATTPSLEALHAYALALDEGRVNPRLEAIPHLKRAIELDPDFAMALALLSGVYANTNQTALAPDLSRRAFALRDRVSERERFFISWRYYRDAAQTWDKALELAQSWTATYPREAFAFNSLGVAYLYLGQYEKTVDPFRQALRLDPKFVPPYSNLAASLMALSRYEEARALLSDATAQGFSGSHRIAYLLAFIAGDETAMSKHFDASVGIGATNAAYGWRAHVAAYSGRLGTAHDDFRQGIQMASQGGFHEVAAQLSIEDAEAHAIVGDCQNALKEVPAGLALNRDNFSLERANRTFALCDATREVSAVTAELERRYPEATVTNRMSLPVTAAVAAIRRREWTRALEILEPVTPVDRSAWSELWPAYLRGQAQLGLRRPAEAATEFQIVLDRRGEAPLSQLYPLAHLGLARAAALGGDATRAREMYDAFLALWRDADATLPLVREARLELANLRPRPKGTEVGAGR